MLQEVTGGNSLAVQWLRFSASTAESLGLIPGQGNKIPHSLWCDQKKKKRGLKNICLQWRSTFLIKAQPHLWCVEPGVQRDWTPWVLHVQCIKATREGAAPPLHLLVRGGIACHVRLCGWGPAKSGQCIWAEAKSKKGKAKACPNYRTIALISHASKEMLKILQARLQ